VTANVRAGGLLDRIVMVIDTNHEARNALSDFLRLHGYLAFGESTAPRALAYLDMGLRPCAIILNVPESDAMRFRSRQVTDRRLRGIPVIIGARVGDRPSTLEELREGRSVPGSEELLALVTEVCARSASRSRDHLRVVGRSRDRP
jgi:hypothetical protein